MKVIANVTDRMVAEDYCPILTTIVEGPGGHKIARRKTHTYVSKTLGHGLLVRCQHCGITFWRKALHLNGGLGLQVGYGPWQQIGLDEGEEAPPDTNVLRRVRARVWAWKGRLGL